MIYAAIVSVALMAGSGAIPSPATTCQRAQFVRFQSDGHHIVRWHNDKRFASVDLDRPLTLAVDRVPFVFAVDAAPEWFVADLSVSDEIGTAAVNIVSEKR